MGIARQGWWQRRGLPGAVFATAMVCCIGANAQTPAFNRDTVVLDPAHGGPETGARIADSVLEKDVTLALAARLRSLLAARGFIVVATREDDGSASITTDRRAEVANKAHAVACIVIHGSSSAGGVALGTSAIGSPLSSVKPDISGRSSGVVAWDRAQEAYLPQSLRLANQVGLALVRSDLPVAMGRVALRPLDNLMCPAISVEIGSLSRGGSDQTPVSDAGYQQRVAEAIAGALVLWRNQAQPPEYVPVPRPAAQAPRPQVPAPQVPAPQVPAPQVPAAQMPTGTPATEVSH